MKPAGIRSKLAIARGLGAAGEGVGHWWMQRVTAVALVPLSFWFVSSLMKMTKGEISGVAQWLSSPWSALPMLALIVALFWHAKLGTQVVIEDYVHHPVMKYSLLLANSFFCWAAGIMCAVAVLKLHILGIQ